MDCLISSAERLTERLFSLWLDFDGEINCAPGQFLHIKCGDERLLRRPISICDQKENRLRIVFEKKGEGTAWLAGRREGDRLNVMPPRGHGFESGGKVLVAGGGIGAPPMLLAAKRADSASAVLGFKTAEAVILAGEFAEVCKTVDITTEDGSLGEKGFLTLPMEKRLSQEHFDRVLACGPRPMLRAVYETAKKHGVPCFVSMEERMGCGIGACLVCACSIGGHYKHVCKDGPVFNGDEVDWNA